MSGLVKGVGKTFKKVLKVAKVVVPIALAVGAIVLTGGAAMGLALPTWGAAVTSVFGTSALGAIASGAVVSAGYGAAIGAAVGLATGGTKGLVKGAQMGAITGAVTGGITGGMTYTPGQTALQQAAAIDPIGAAVTDGAMHGSEVTKGVGAGTITETPLDAPAGSASTGTSLSQPVAQSATRGMTAGAQTAASGGGGFWAGAAGPIVGGVLSAGGQAIAAASAGDEQDRYDANYRMPNSQEFLKPRAMQVANPGGRPGAELSLPRGNGRWRYNAEDGEFEFVPDAN